MKKVFTILAGLFLFPAILLAQQQLFSFDSAPADTNFWKWYDHVVAGADSGIGGHYQINASANPDSGYINLNYVDDPVYEGSGAVQLDYSIHNKESWGGYAKVEHWHPDSTKTYDFSNYDSISVMYYVKAKQSLPGRITFRLCLQDVSNSPDGNATYTNDDCEYYYSFENILDDDPGWHEIKLPLMADPNYWNGEGFNLTGWAGIHGNGALDLDKIKGFTFEFSINGAGEGDISQGTIVIDDMELKGVKAVPFIFFNGRNVPNNLSSFTWGQSTLEVEEGTGATEGTNSLKWVQGNEYNNGWSGAGFNIDPPINMSIVWPSDSIKFKMKADDGTGTIRLQFEDGTAKRGMAFDPITDGAWHNYAFKLSDFIYEDGTSNFDSSSVKVFQFMGEATAIAGKVIYFDDLWTGNPVIDVVAPDAPTGVNAIASDYYNLVIWQDVPGESGEIYTVYASTQPITNLDDPAVDLVADNIQEDTQTAAHWLYYPLADTDVEYYYAVTCTDASGNVSKTFATSAAVTNTAKGIATISLSPPADFVADGDLNEWDASGIMPFNITPENDHVAVGTVTDSEDLSANIYMAIDDDNLYVAADVIDDVFHYGEGNWWDQDAFQMFIGLYDQRGVTHGSLKRGEQPDFILYAVPDRLVRDNPGGAALFTPENDNYYFSDLGGSDYVIEAKIPLDSLMVAGDTRFHPVRGMRIPLDLYFHDNDGDGWEGNLGFSPLSTDHQWQHPYEWLYTWIGDTTNVTGVQKSDKGMVVSSYELAQNYPNPFNPTTTISYSLGKSGLVEIQVFNRLGQMVEALVNKKQPAGAYRITFSGGQLPSGVYFYRIKAGNFSQTKKMILMK